MTPQFPYARATMIVAVVFALLMFPGCRRSASTPDPDTVVIGIPADVHSFNPLFASDVTAAEINELIYPMLVNAEFDSASGSLVYTTGLAHSWETRRNGTELVFHLNSRARWADGTPIRAEDVRRTFMLYADTAVGSVWESSLDGLRREKDGSLDIQKAVEIPDDSTAIFHFAQAYPGQLFDVGLPILPAHILAGVKPGELRSHAINQQPVGAGPFRLERHVAMQEIVLGPNPTSVLPRPSGLRRLVFLIVPDYHSRLMQLASGTIDIMAEIETEDIPHLQQSSPEIRIIPTPPRRYHFIGWNNIDPVSWNPAEGGNPRAHPLFGNPRVRRALTMAINRRDLMNGLLGPFGVEAFGPVSPMFHWAINDSLQPVPFDPAQAAKILKGEGWIDHDGDGILDRNGVPFSFVLKVPGGNVMWSDIATVVQKQLRDIHIDARIDIVERSVFWPDLLAKKFDAWIAAFEVPLEPRLTEMWNSDLRKNPFNVLSYRSPAMDGLLESFRSLQSTADRGRCLRRIQSLIAEDQPCTFLFWERGRIAAHRRVEGIHSTILALTHEAWDWRIAPGN